MSEPYGPAQCSPPTPRKKATMTTIIVIAIAITIAIKKTLTVIRL